MVTSLDKARLWRGVRDELERAAESLETERIAEQAAEIARLRECVRGLAEQLADAVALTSDAELRDAALDAVEQVGDADLTQHFAKTEAASRMLAIRETVRSARTGGAA